MTFQSCKYHLVSTSPPIFHDTLLKNQRQETFAREPCRLEQKQGKTVKRTGVGIVEESDLSTGDTSDSDNLLDKNVARFGVTAWKGMTMKSLEKHPPKRLSLWFTVSSLPTFYFRPLSFHPPSPAFPSSISDRLILSCVSSRSLFFIGRLPRTQTSSTRPRKTFLLSRRLRSRTAHHTRETRFTFYVLELNARGTFVTLGLGKMSAQFF